jgi:hypothetical protein
MASFRTVNCIVTLVSSCANVWYFFWSLVYNLYNCSSKIHLHCSCSNFLRPSLDSNAFCCRRSYFVVRTVIFHYNSMRFELNPSVLFAFCMSNFDLGRPMSNIFNALAASILSNLNSKPRPLLKRTALPVESSPYIAIIGLELLGLAASTTTAAPRLASLDIVPKLSGTSLCTYSILSFIFLVNNVC